VFAESGDSLSDFKAQQKQASHPAATPVPADSLRPAKKLDAKAEIS
jgi:hypothetical protein